MSRPGRIAGAQAHPAQLDEHVGCARACGRAGARRPGPLEEAWRGNVVAFFGGRFPEHREGFGRADLTRRAKRLRDSQAFLEQGPAGGEVALQIGQAARQEEDAGEAGRVVGGRARATSRAADRRARPSLR